MRQEHTVTNQDDCMDDTAPSSAFAYLKSLPANYDNPVLDSYKRSRDSKIIDHQIAEDFTRSFRTPSQSFFIPVSWSMTKAALINLLGITAHEGFDEVNGVRFYAGINDDRQLTLVAVTTKAGDGCSDDLTYAESYPYYDYAKPCPTDCSNRGNLKVQNGLAAMVEVGVR